MATRALGHTITVRTHTNAYMIDVTLNRMEVAVAKWTAKRKEAHSKENGYRSFNTQGRSDLAITEEGMLGEMAACKYYNAYFRPAPDPNEGGADMITPAGLGVDVKATEYRDGRSTLIVGAQKFRRNTDVDAYLLVARKNSSQHVLAGWYPAAPIHTRPDEHRVPLGTSVVHGVNQPDLLDPEILTYIDDSALQQIIADL